MKSHVLQQSMIAIVFAIVIPYTLWWGVQIVAPMPRDHVFYKNFEEAYKKELKSINKKRDELDKVMAGHRVSKEQQLLWQDKQKLWHGSKMYKEFLAKEKEHHEVKFWSSSLVGLGALTFGSVMALPIVGSGIMVAGGLLVGNRHPKSLKLLHALVVTIALLAMIGLAYQSTVQQKE